jgi:hypothetical protein
LDVLGKCSARFSSEVSSLRKKLLETMLEAIVTKLGSGDSYEDADIKIVATGKQHLDDEEFDQWMISYNVYAQRSVDSSPSSVQVFSPDWFGGYRARYLPCSSEGWVEHIKQLAMSIANERTKKYYTHAEDYWEPDGNTELAQQH